MAIIIAGENGGFTGSLDMSENFNRPLGNPNVSINRVAYAGYNSIFYAGQRFGPPDEGPTTAFANITAIGYSNAPPESAPYNEDGIPVPTNKTYAFKGDGGFISLYDSVTGNETSLTIKEAYFSDTLSFSGLMYPASPDYKPAKGAVAGLQEGINASSITFIGGSQTDIIKVAGGALAYDDVLYGHGGNDILEGGAGADRIYGGVGNDFLDGGTGDDRLFGGNETDQLFGGEGNDLLDGGLGGDRMSGGLGNDTYVVDNIYDVVLEQSGQGIDTVLSSISYRAPGPVENVTLTGDAAIDATGNGLRNELIGNRAANILDGGGYDDILDGKGGADTLIGGAGFDTFVFARGEANGDTILDFAGYGSAYGDRIVFKGYDPGASLVKVGAETYQIVDGASLETITIRGVVDVSDYVFV